jgi:hypothetical protein
MGRAKPAKKGQALACEVCGLVVVVDEVCDCMEAHEIVCCDVPMKKRAPAAAKRTPARPRAAKPKAAKPKPRARARKK